jgi:hypothetical protein
MTGPLVLLEIPGGPYRLDVSEPSCSGSAWWTASEMCICSDGAGEPHWHEVASARTFEALTVDLFDLAPKEAGR